MEIQEAFALLNDAYLSGEADEILAAEYTCLLALLLPLTEWEARHQLYETLPSILEIVAGLIPHQLPDGAAPSLSDTLYALDIAFADWQADDSPSRRWQARLIGTVTSQIVLLIGERQ